jgi:hypothetical protein
MFIIRLFVLLTMMLPVAPGLFAQAAMSPAKKVISKNIPVTDKDVFSIVGEKATIQVKGWEKNFIALKITFSATHTDKNIATKELEYMHYALTREKNTIELRNAFIFPAKTDQLKSSIEVLIEAMVPAGITLSVFNKYGDANLTELSGKIVVTLEFSDLSLSHLSGGITLQSAYSEIRGDRITTSSFVSRDEESKYTLGLEKGRYSFYSRHGDLDLTLSTIQSLSIDASHTDVTLRPGEFASYNYQLSSKDGKIYLPPLYNHLIKKENHQNQVSVNHHKDNPTLTVKTTFNTITIQ